MDYGFKKYSFGHFTPQSEWFLDRMGGWVPDFVGRFEMLGPDFSELSRYLNEGTEIPLAKKKSHTAS